MAVTGTVRLWQRFEATIHGVTHSGGSITSATSISVGVDNIVDLVKKAALINLDDVK